MRRLNFLIPCLVASSISYGQNIVNNPSFETRTGNPNGLNQMNLCTGWSSNTNRTTDYKATTGSGASGQGSTTTTDAFYCQFLPSWGGRSECGPVFDGTAVSAFFVNVFNAPQSRETAHGSLTTPMTIGTSYDVSFALRSSQNFALENAHCTDNWGVLFTTTSTAGVNWQSTSPAWWAARDNVHTPTGTVIDNIDWVEYSFTLTATAANSFIAIGNMLDEASMSWWHYGNGGVGGNYWMDDVVVQEVVPLADDEIEIVARVISKEEIEIKWEPFWLDIESNYELLRSSDGKSFVTVDKVNGNDFAEFKSIDVNLGSNNIYYKVREIQEDGKRRSSNEVRVSNPFITGGLELSVMNLDNSLWNIGFVGDDIGITTINIIDIEGRVVYSELIEISKGKNQFDLNVVDLQPGVYIFSMNGLGQKKVLVH